jgi:Bacterial membrane protein YfhO
VATRGALLSSAAVILLWLFGREVITARWLLFTIGALTAVDLFSIHQPSLVFADWESLLRAGATRAEVSAQGERWFHYCTNSPRCLPQGAPGLGPWNGFLHPGESVERQARALWAALVPDAPMVYRRGAVAGSDGFSTRAQEEFFRTLALLPRERAVHLLASLGVSRLIGREPLDSLAGLADAHEGRDASTWEYSLSERAPHAYLAERVLVAPDTASALKGVAEPSFRPGRDAILTASSRPRLGAELAGRTLAVSSSPDAIRAEVALPAEGLWVVCDTWFPGWEATVDGAVAEVLRVNGIHRGVRVPAGSHLVEMRYRPRSFRIGLAVSAGAVISLLIVVLLARRERET